MKILILYATTTGNTGYVGEILKSLFSSDEVTIKNVEEIHYNDLVGFDFYIFGTPTWGEGEMHKSWKAFFNNLNAEILAGKKVAIYGLGDSLMFPDRFVDGMRELYDCVKKVGGIIIGRCPTLGYNFLSSKAIVDGEFCGLPIDQDNESAKTVERLSEWVKRISREL